jgi:bis(5'-adenosyl)-triphosphatase
MILRLIFPRSQFLSFSIRTMSSSSKTPIHFGPFEVTDQVRFQFALLINFEEHPLSSCTGSTPIIYRLTLPQVFHTTPLCYALVNIKPILPGHVLVVPFRKVPRMTDLTANEITDLFTTVQKVQSMLAKRYFPPSPSSASPLSSEAALESGSFNLAIQDGPESGQTVPHVHCHIIPRTKESSGEGDGIYDRLQGEEGNVGGGLWDLRERPEQRGKFPRIEEDQRKPRSKEDMNAEAEMYKELMRE